MIENIRRLVPTVIRRSYALKFAIALLLLGASIAAIGFVATAQLTDSVEANALEDQEALAAQEATTIDNWNEQNERRTASTSNTPVVESGDAEAIESYLYDLQLDLSGQVADIHYVDQESHELLATTAGDASTLSDVAFPEEDRERIDADLSAVDVSRTEPYAVDGTPVVSYYISTNGSSETAIVMSFELEDLLTDFGGSIDDDTVTLAVDRDGRLVLDDTFTGTGQDALQDDFVDTRFQTEYADEHGILADALATDNASYSNAMAFEEPPSDTLRSEYDFAPDGYVAASHGTDMGLVVVMHTSTDEAYGFVNSVNQYGTMATIAGVALIGLIGAVIGRNTSKSIDRLTGKVAEMETGDLDVDLESPRIDNIGRLYDGFDSMRDELKAQIEEAESARADAEAERERVQEMNDHLEEKADAYGEVMQAAADGDLTVRMDPESDNEAMAEIGAEFNAMLTEIERTVAELNEFATHVATASEQVTASSEEVQRASREVSESIQEISDGADRQHQSLQSVDSEMNTLSTTTEEIAASSNEVADIAARTAETGHDGKETAEVAIDACDDLESEYREVVAEFEQLRDQIDRIEDLTDTISEIAEQTNMLALNANIEASRSASGDDAEGFSAVASEVKDLSEDTKDAAAEIDERLDALQDQTERSAEVVDRTSEEIEQVNDLVSDVVTALDEIAAYAADTNDGVQEISRATEEQAASTEEVVAMVDEVATISEETTSEAETVAAAAEEQTSSMAEVSESVGDLSQQATRLSGALDRFDTDVSDAELTLEGDAGFDELEAADADEPDETDDEPASADAAETDTDAPTDERTGVATSDGEPAADGPDDTIFEFEANSSEDPAETTAEGADDDAAADGESEAESPSESPR